LITNSNAKELLFIIRLCKKDKAFFLSLALFKEDNSPSPSSLGFWLIRGSALGPIGGLSARQFNSCLPRIGDEDGDHQRASLRFKQTLSHHDQAGFARTSKSGRLLQQAAIRHAIEHLYSPQVVAISKNKQTDSTYTQNKHYCTITKYYRNGKKHYRNYRI